MKKLLALLIVGILVAVSLISGVMPAGALRFGNKVKLNKADASFRGLAGFDNAGISVANVGDVNGDGYADFMVGALFNDYGGFNTGAAYLILGKAAGWSTDKSLSTSDASFYAKTPSDYAGNWVAGIGDVNGDGFKDFAVSSYGNNSLTGKVYVFFGKASGWAMNTPLVLSNASYIGEGTNNFAGMCVAAAGDVNGDGYDDFLIGAPGNDQAYTDAGKAYLILGKPTGWANNVSLSNADATYLGEAAGDMAGTRVAGAGDVNGDGLSDILVVSSRNTEGGNTAGQSYLILGKSTGWTKNVNLSKSDASFIGKNANSAQGMTASGLGDINGDGYSDFAIGQEFNNDNGVSSGQVFIFFGRPSGWAMDTKLINANASLQGEAMMDSAGHAIAGVGDVNGDGFDDFLVGAYNNKDNGNGAGKVYLMLGHASGWAMSDFLANSNASFLGETTGDNAGTSVSGGGDVNGDGNPDILIGSPYNSEAGTSAGESYLLFPELNFKPSAITGVKAFDDTGYSNQINTANIYERVYVEMTGTDTNASHADVAFVNLTSNISSTKGVQMKLYESGNNTGKYRGSFYITNRTDAGLRWLNVSKQELVTIRSVQDPTKFTTLIVKPIALYPKINVLNATEDSAFSSHFWSVGNSIASWKYKSNASWLSWDAMHHNISGTPDNSNVGTFWVDLRISDTFGNFDERNLTLTVANMPPLIITTNILGASEHKYYNNTYKSTDDGQGKITWHLSTNGSWLKMNTTTGNLSGIPQAQDIGRWYVNVSVDDGNGGRAWTNFTLTVVNVNDPPHITTGDVTTVLQDQPYNVTYSAVDQDKGDKIAWNFATNATNWLHFDANTAHMYGAPSNADVGWYWVNITVTDLGGLSDSHEFNLTVVNVNDPPKITSTPVLAAVVFFQYRYQVTGADIDKGQTLTFKLDTAPANMTIDKATGVITWAPTKDQKGLNQVLVNATDGQLWALQEFNITVSVPQIVLQAPGNGTVLTETLPELVWSFGYNGTQSTMYSLYWGMAPNTTKFEDFVMNGNRYKMKSPLKDNTTYYWHVVPTVGSLNGDPSPTWSFRVQLPFVPIYKVILDFDRSKVDAHRGDHVRVNLTVYNDGNVGSFVNLTLSSGLDPSVFTYAKQVWVPALSFKVVALNITVPKAALFMTYDITVSAQLHSASNNKTLTLNVIKQPTPPVKQKALYQEPAFWLIVVVIGCVAGGGVGYMAYKRKKDKEARFKAEKELQEAKAAADEVEDFTIDEVFLIYQDGRLISHVAPKESAVDNQLFSGMLIAIQSFVKDSFKAEEGLTSFEFGSRKIILERGTHVFLATALSGVEPKILKGQMRELLQKVEGLYAGVVEHWDGNSLSFKDVELMLVGIFGIKEGLKIKKEKEEVKVLSGVEFFSGFVRLKVAIKNELSTGVKNVTLKLFYDDKVLRLDHIEPEYQMEGPTVVIGEVGKDEKRTVAFYLDPIICQESKVDAMLTFVDEYGHMGEVYMKTRPVDIVCPIFYTPETMNVAMLKRLLETLKYSDSKIFSLSTRKELEIAYKQAIDTVGGYDIRFIREFKEDTPFKAESWFYGEVKETGEQLVIKVASGEIQKYLQIFVSSSNLASMTGLLAELGAKFRRKVEDKDKMVQKPEDKVVLKPMKDQKARDEIERSVLLLDKYAESEIKAHDE